MKTVYFICSFCMIFVFQLSAQVKTVLIEEFSSTSCSLCPPRTQQLKEWSETSAQHIAVVHHARSNDNMSNLEPGLELGDIYKVYAQPTVFLNRKYYENADEDLALSIDADLFDKATAELNEAAQLSVEFMNMSWDEDNRVIVGEIRTEFFDNISGDINLGLYVIEDNVTGGLGGPTLQYGNPDASNFTGVSAYDQKASDGNWVAQNHPDLNYEDQFIERYPHFNVVRSAPFSTFGTDNFLPSDPFAGLVSTYNINIEIPEYYDPTPVGEPVDLNEIKLVAFIANYSNDILERSILNGTIIELESFLDPSSLTQPNSEELSISISPNPCQDLVQIAFKNPAGTSYSYFVSDMDGRKLMVSNQGNSKSGFVTEEINVSNLPSGMYNLTIVCGNNIDVRLISKI